MQWFRRSVGFGVSLAFLGGVGCSSNPEDAGEAVWTDDSDAVAIRWSSYWQGSARFEKRRDELTEEELTLLADLRTLASSDTCWEDAGEARVTVSRNGSGREYFANEYDGTCDRNVELVTYAPVLGLIESAGCLSAKSYDGSSLAAAARVRADDGCLHGIFNGSQTTPDWWFTFDVAEPSTYRVTVDGCGDRELDLVLLDEAGDNVLSNATTAPGACPLLVHTFATAGTYALHLDMSAGTYAGDFYLSVKTDAPN